MRTSGAAAGLVLAALLAAGGCASAPSPGGMSPPAARQQTPTPAPTPMPTQRPEATADRIPAGVTAVIVNLRPGPPRLREFQPSGTFKTRAVVTDPAKVRRIVALVDALRPRPPGVYHCPPQFGGSVMLTFRDGGRAAAFADAGTSGCGTVSILVDGSAQPVLSGGPELAVQVLRLAGLG